ncbi:MAG: hypothetical protein DCC43_15935 [Candidatus Brocadia sp.]|nr:hypothetical protein [Candidatus Brocadia sp. AMX3]RIJ88639.1 MAG: hypothetical protein DCC43_15935 [Candidatus Brocadia sp.]
MVFSAKGRVLILIHTERQGKIRVINCRKATTHKRRFLKKAISKEMPEREDMKAGRLLRKRPSQ